MFRVWKQFSSAVSSAAKAGRPMAAMAVVTALTFRKLRREIFLENITKFLLFALHVLNPDGVQLGVFVWPDRLVDSF